MNFYLPDYSVITSNGFCRNVNRKSINDNPARCQKIYVRQESICKDFCTFLSWCVGYAYDFGNNNYCTLYASNKDFKCPSGFTTYRNADVVETANDLEAIYYNNYACYGKNSGEIGLRLQSFNFFAIIF